MLTAIRPRFFHALVDALIRLTQPMGEFPTRRRARGLGRDPRAAAWITLALRLNRRTEHCFDPISAGRSPRGVFHGGGCAALHTHASAAAVGNARFSGLEVTLA